jgi:hypothetical protein
MLPVVMKWNEKVKGQKMLGFPVGAGDRGRPAGDSHEAS